MADFETFDHETQAVLRQIHSAWHQKSPITTFAAIRDQLLRERVSVDVRISTLGVVAKLAYPSLGLSDSRRNDADAHWDEFYSVVARIDEEQTGITETRRKRKRDSNAVFQRRSLALITALWSPEIVGYYGWHMSSRAMVSALLACTKEYPRFEDFLPRLNANLLQRHKESIWNRRSQPLNERPLQFKDLELGSLRSAKLDDEALPRWTSSTDGAVEVNAVGTLLKTLRPHHFHLYLLELDHYGMLCPRQEHDTAMYTSVVERRAPLPSRGVVFAHSLHTFDGRAFPLNGHHAANNDSVATCLVDREEYRLSPAFSLTDSIFETAAGLRRSDQSTQPAGFESLDSVTHVWPAESEGHFNAGLSNLELAPTSTLRNGWSSEILSVDLNATNTSTIIRDGPQTLDSDIHRKHKDLVTAYIDDLIKECSVVEDDATRSATMRLNWLNHGTRWAKIWTPPDAELALSGAAVEEDSADVCYYSSRELLRHAKNGKIFSKPIVIKEYFGDAGLHTVPDLATLIVDGCRDLSQVTRLQDGPSEIVDFEELIEGLRSNSSATTSTAMAFKSRNLVRAQKPSLTTLQRFRLLQTLTDRVRNNVTAETRARLSNLDIQLGFNIFGRKNAFTQAQANAFGGTWIRNLQGLKFWTFIPESESRDVPLSDSYRHYANCSPDGYWPSRLVVLEEDDVLFIPPGAPIVHTIHSPGECLMEGGLIWDDLSVAQTIHVMNLIRNLGVGETNECDYRHAHCIAELEQLVTRECDRFRGEKSKEEFEAVFDDLVQGWRKVIGK